jgi:hypothetical protein
MRVMHGGLTLSFDPISWVWAGAPTELFVQLEPAADGARVEVAYRMNGGRTLRRQARPLATGDGGGARFAVELPAFRPGDSVACKLVGRIGKRRVPGARDNAASFRLEARKARISAQDTPWLARPIEELAPAAEQKWVRARRRDLAKRGIATAADLLGAGEEAFDGLAKSDRDFVQRPAAHAELALTVDDAAERSGLIDADFASASSIAAAPLAEFRRRVGSFMDGTRAEGVHRSASIQAAFLDSLAIGGRSGAAAAETDRPCVCEDCESATSPIAYLTDLLRYIRLTVLYRVHPPGGMGLRRTIRCRRRRRPATALRHRALVPRRHRAGSQGAPGHRGASPASARYGRKGRRSHLQSVPGSYRLRGRR